MTTKEKVLERCGELHDSIIYGNKIEFEWWTFKPQLPMGYVLSGINFTIQVGESVPETDPVWPLAAQVLGIGVETADPFQSFINSSTSSMIWELCESFFLNGMAWANSDMGDVLTEGDKIRFENVWAENSALVHGIAKSLNAPNVTLEASLETVVDEKDHNYVKELLRQAFLQGRDTSGMPEKDALASFHRAEKEYYLPQFGNPQNLIDALQKIASDGHERDFDAAEFAEIALEDWENNAKPSPKKIEGHTFRQLLEENIRLLKSKLEHETPDIHSGDIPLSLDGVRMAGKAILDYKPSLTTEQAAKNMSNFFAPKPDWVREEIKEMMQATDTLKEDMELVRNHIDLFYPLENTALHDPENCVELADKLHAALKRLCGMGVGG